MEQQRYDFNKEQGTKGTAQRAAIFLSFYLFHIWSTRVKAHHLLVVSEPHESVVTLMHSGRSRASSILPYYSH